MSKAEHTAKLKTRITDLERHFNEILTNLKLLAVVVKDLAHKVDHLTKKT